MRKFEISFFDKSKESVVVDADFFDVNYCYKTSVIFKVYPTNLVDFNPNEPCVLNQHDALSVGYYQNVIDVKDITNG